MRYLNRRARALALFAFLVLAACAPQSTDAPIHQTAASLETQISAIRRSATVAAERMQITVVGSRNQLDQIASNYAALSGTLAARGYDPAALSPPTTTDANAPQITQSPALSNAPTLAITPPSPRITAQLTPARSAPTLSDFRIGLAIGSDDCVSAPNLTFTADAPAIYASARARDLPADAQLRTLWFAAGVERVALSYSPEFAITDHCVWFFIDSSDAPFVSGDWAVSWELGGVPYPRQSFTIAPN